MPFNEISLSIIAIIPWIDCNFVAQKRRNMAKQMSQEEIQAQQEQLMHEMSKRIARRVDRELFEREMSHKDFAELINHSQGVVSRWLNGKHNFTLSTLALISLTLDIDLLEPQ